MDSRELLRFFDLLLYLANEGTIEVSLEGIFDHDHGYDQTCVMSDGEMKIRT